MNLVWTPSFTRMAKRLLRQNPQLRSQVQKTLEQLANDPFHPKLKTHKLKGELSGRWSFLSTTATALFSNLALIQKLRLRRLYYLLLGPMTQFISAFQLRDRHLPAKR